MKKTIKQNKCKHKFVIERGGFDSRTGKITFWDMRCENCGLALFVPNPQVHKGDEANHLPTIKD